MGRIFCVMGKSASGKDSIFKELMHDKSLKLKNIVPYTTRPIRDGEQDGKDYIFCTEADVQRLESENKIIELREYNTVYGIWKYFTVDDGQIDLSFLSFQCTYSSAVPLRSHVTWLSFNHISAHSLCFSVSFLFCKLTKTISTSRHMHMCPLSRMLFPLISVQPQDHSDSSSSVSFERFSELQT